MTKARGCPWGSTSPFLRPRTRAVPNGGGGRLWRWGGPGEKMGRLCFCFCRRPWGAVFEDKSFSARSAALGGALVAAADPGGATPANPAMLPFLVERRVSAGRSAVAGLEELDRTTLGAVFPQRPLSWAVGLAEFGGPLYREREITAAGGWAAGGAFFRRRRGEGARPGHRALRRGPGCSGGCGRERAVERTGASGGCACETSAGRGISAKRRRWFCPRGCRVCFGRRRRPSWRWNRRDAGHSNWRWGQELGFGPLAPPAGVPIGPRPAVLRFRISVGSGPAWTTRS
jgi:hypothetical protein